MELNKPANLPPLFLNFEASSTSGYSKIALLTAYDFFDWWYIKMPIYINRHINRYSEIAFDQLSITLLLKTFLVPWHRDYNPVGYFIGIAVRLLYLPIAIFVAMLVVVIGYIMVFAWLLLPIISIIFVLLTPFIQ